MAFWGVEVKSGRSVTHSSRESGGRLRISQATLGLGDAIKKSVVQCNVGNRTPVLLCVLIPNQTESCHLDLEFEEADDVVFSVLGPRSVYLTGYYVRPSKSNAQSETESYGEDVENTQSESSFCSDDDAYEDSFIDDDEELQVSSPTPVSGSKAVDEISPEDDEFRVKKARSKRHISKYKIFDSDTDSIKSQGEENGYLKSNGDAMASAREETTQVKNKSKRSGEITVKEALPVNKSHKNKSVDDGQVQPLNEEKLKKKRKSSCKDGITLTQEVESDGDPYVTRKEKENMVDSGKNSETGIRPIDPPSESGAENRGRSKRRKESHSEGASQEKDFVGKTDADQSEKKTKKKKKKISLGELNSQPDSNQKRTLSNGLIIEDLAFGPVDGKEAAAGQKVKIFYTAMSEENGRVLDTNVGKAPWKFRLGSKGNTDGWKYGITGMRIGDKRRLVVPPSLGRGEDGAVENVPPNSWVVYEVELIDVKK